MYRIYIVEDDESISASIKNHIEKWGITAKCTENFRLIISFWNLNRTLCFSTFLFPFTMDFIGARK